MAMLNNQMVLCIHVYIYTYIYIHIYISIVCVSFHIFPVTNANENSPCLTGERTIHDLANESDMSRLLC